MEAGLRTQRLYVARDEHVAGGAAAAANAADDWEHDAEDFSSFGDSERFEEDSLCSWMSDAESLNNNWTGWTARPTLPTSLSYTGGIATTHVQGESTANDYPVLSLVELCSREVARQIPFEIVEHFYPPVPEQLQLRIAFWSFPENEEDIRLYSCLANGNVDDYLKGEQLYRVHAVKDLLQIGFHLSATVTVPSAPVAQRITSHQASPPLPAVLAGPSVSSSGTSFSVAVTLDRRRITSCTCTCSSVAFWCAHVVAVCLHRINRPDNVCLRAPVSESLSRLERDQLQKFAQYLISELPRQILPTAQKLLDELLSQSTAINVLCGAPDPTAGASILELASWCLEDATLHDNIRKILIKFCIPAPTVLSDVNYLTSNAPPAASEWQSVLQALVGRLPEGLWNLLSIVCEMYRRRDGNATHLLEIITRECLACDQVVVWWYTTRLAQSLRGSQTLGVNNIKTGFGNTATAQYSCALLMDEVVLLWRMAALEPSLCPSKRSQLLAKLKGFHVQTVEKVGRLVAHAQNGDAPSKLAGRLTQETCHFDLESFPGFKVAIESCLITWENFSGMHFRQRFLGDCYVRTDHPAPTAVDNLQNVSPVSPLSQGSTSPTLPVLRSKQYRSFSALRLPTQLTGLRQRCASNDDSAHSSDESGRESGPSSAAPDTKKKFFESAPQLLVGAVVEAAVKEIKHVADAPVAVAEDAVKNVGDDLEKLYMYDPDAQAMSSNSTGGKPKRQQPGDIVREAFEGLTPCLEAFELKFARAEALHAHGYTREACTLSVELAQELLANPPDLMVEIPLLPQPPPAVVLTPNKQGRKKKRSLDLPLVLHPLAHKISQLACATLQKVTFLCNVLSGVAEFKHLAFQMGLFGLELPRQPAATKFLEVRMNQQETMLIELLRKLAPFGHRELQALRDRANKLRTGQYTHRAQPVLPFSLASFVFEVLSCLNGGFSSARLPTDDQLGFDAAIGVLGMRSCVSEAEHPLLCEGLRRQRGELALNLLLKYKDHQDKLSLIVEKLLDREMHQMYKHHVNNAAYYHVHGHGSTSFAGGGSGSGRNSVSGPAGVVVPNVLPPMPGPVQAVACDAVHFHRSFSGISEVSMVAEDSNEDSSQTLDDSFLNGDEIERDEPSPTWDDEAIESLRLSRRESLENSRAQETASTESSSSGVSQGLGASTNTADLRRNDSSVRSSTPPSVVPKNSVDPLNKACYYKLARYRRHYTPNLPNQPSEAHAHFMFELAKTLLTKAGGTHSTAIFTAGSHSSNQQPNGAGPHRALHLCAFQIGLYALGLHNKVSPNWPSRTYSSHVSWLSGQALEIGRVAIRILIDAWENHLTPTEVANLADKSSQGRDPAMVQAAAELALSALPQAHALNPTEIQRALVQCREQNTSMLEKACLAVENAAKDGGVYPEVLFMVARQWYTLYTESVTEQNQQNNGQPGANQNNMHVAGGAMANNAEPVLGFQQQMHPSGLPVFMGPNVAMRPPNAGQMQVPQAPVLNVGGNAALPPGVLGMPVTTSPAALGLQMAAAAQQAAANAAAGYPPTGSHLLQHPGAAMAYPSFITLPYNPTAAAPMPVYLSANGPAYGPAGFPMYPQAAGFRPQGQAVFVCQPPPFGFANNMLFNQRIHLSHSAPNLVPLNMANGEDLVAQQQGQIRYLYAAYRVGMLAMETMGRRMLDDNRNYVKFAQNPPYGDDVKWLFKMSKKLGVVAVQQFCVAAAQSVVSPFVLYDLAVEAASLLARGTTPLAKAFTHQYIQPLMARCTHMFYQAAHQKLSHPRFTPSDAEELIALVRAAKVAFYQTPNGQISFNEFFQSLKRQKACKKDLWNRLQSAVNSST